MTQWNISSDTYPNLGYLCSSKASPVVFHGEVQQKLNFSIDYGHNLHNSNKQY